MNLVYLNKKGFTLLEVIISLSIMVMISFGIYQTTTETYKLRESLTNEGDFYNSIRLSMGVLQQDLTLLYSPSVSSLKSQSPNQINPQQPTAPPTPEEMTLMTADDLIRVFNFWTPAIEVSGLRPSRFLGESEKMSFISLSHLRIYKETLESDFAKISYELKEERANPEHPGTYCLMKTESPNAFISDDLKDTLGRTCVLLKGIKKLTFSYLQRDGQAWKTFKSWDSNQQDTKNIYPQIIEVNFEVLGRKKLSFTGKFKFRAEIPLNGLNASF